MFYEDFVLDKEISEAADHRAHYDGESLQIQYFLPFMMEGPIDVIDTISHEWLHGLIDWALLGPNGEYTQEWLEKYKNDKEGSRDHFIIKLINYGE